MALSTLTSGFASFKRGFYWGASHSVGVMLLCPIFLVLEHLSSKTMSRETWEHFGDTFIGISVMGLSIYFLYYKDSYLERRADGKYVARGCGCHGQSPLTEQAPQSSHPCTAPTNLTTSAGETGCSDKETRNSPSRYHFSLTSFLGLLQGLCCPVGMTAGTGFMSRITATASTPMIVGFMV
jgi:hypothetical protein